MAITKLGHQKAKPHLKNAIDYITAFKKTDGGQWIGCRNCLNPYEDFIKTKKAFHKEGGRQGYHVIISFSDADQEKVNPELTMQIMEEFASLYIPDYEAVYAAHTDTEHIHGHLIFNSIDMIYGKKYHYANGDWAKDVQPITNALCEKYGLETIRIEEATSQKKNLHKGEWLQHKAGLPAWSDYARHDIDLAINQTIEQKGDYETFLQLLRGMGYQLHGVKTLSLCRPGEKKAMRSRVLGDDYEVSAIKERIASGQVRELSEVPSDDHPINTFASCRISPEVAQFIRQPVKIGQSRNRMSLRCIYVVRIHRARQVRRYCYIHPTSPKTWVDRYNSVRINQLMADYTWMVQNHVSVSDDINGKIADYQQEIVAGRRKKKAKVKKRQQLLTQQKLLLESLQEGGTQEDAEKLQTVITELKQLDLEIADLGAEIRQNVSDKAAAERVQQSVQMQIQKEIRNRFDVPSYEETKIHKIEQIDQKDDQKEEGGEEEWQKVQDRKRR